MKKLYALLVAIAVTAACSMFVTGPATSAPPTSHVHVRTGGSQPDCDPFVDSDTAHVEPGAMNNHWVDVKIAMNLKQCIGINGNRWLRPVSVVYSYNREDAGETCGFWDGFDGVRYNLYMSDGSGRNYNAPQVTLPCQTDTTNDVTKSLASSMGVPNFHWCFGAPKWKGLFTVKVDGAPDKDGMVSGGMWNFTGPVPNDCS